VTTAVAIIYCCNKEGYLVSSYYCSIVATVCEQGSKETVVATSGLLYTGTLLFSLL
jgi:hypothetical protein